VLGFNRSSLLLKYILLISTQNLPFGSFVLSGPGSYNIKGREKRRRKEGREERKIKTGLSGDESFKHYMIWRLQIVREKP